MGGPIDTALGIADDAWNELQRSPYIRQQVGIAPVRMPDISLEEVRRHSAVGRELVRRVDDVNLSELPREIKLTLRLVRFRALTWSKEADWYWTVLDPLGVGFFGMFLPSAYCGGFLLNTVNGLLASFRFLESGDIDGYLALVTDYGRLVEQFAARTIAQAERGMRMPKAQVEPARSLLSGFKSGLRDALGVTPERLGDLMEAGVTAELERRIVKDIEPAYDRAIGALSDDYFGRAPEDVGLRQYPGGGQIYADLVKIHTTLDASPEEVHARGHRRMSEIAASMSAIRNELGLDDNDEAFSNHLNQQASWRAHTTEGVAAFFQRYIDRLKPRIAEYFELLPSAPYGVAPLPRALEGSMTYGYYAVPRGEHPEGRYLFNSANLTKQPLHTLGSLTYHELAPGHHLHLATQQENTSLHPFNRYSFVNAYSEGWAEYAATLAGEMGMYEQPEERYGRLVFDALLTCRLVVDTGMNSLGWSLERAREYMRKHTAMTEAEIRSESLRYSCDIPGQSLAYKLGETHILMLRARMMRARGEDFSIKDFHAAILGPGALPLQDLEWHIENEIDRLAASPKR